jgi:DNA repair exonuclease SbcCD ATPase subunit
MKIKATEATLGPPTTKQLQQYEQVEEDLKSIIYKVEWFDPDGEYVATCNVFPHISNGNKNIVSALDGLVVLIRSILHEWLDCNRRISDFHPEKRNIINIDTNLANALEKQMKERTPEERLKLLQDAHILDKDGNYCEGFLLQKQLRKVNLMSKIEELKTKFDNLSKERENLYQERNKLNDLIVPLSEQIEKLRNKIGKLEIEEGNYTIEDLLYSDYIGSKSKKHRIKLEEYLKEFKYFNTSGYYYDEIEQIGISICLDKKANLEVALNGVIKIREHLKVLLDDEYFVRFSVFEQTLSRNGSYVLFVHKTEDRASIIHSYGAELEETTIVDALRYIKKNLWYE